MITITALISCCLAVVVVKGYPLKEDDVKHGIRFEYDQSIKASFRGRVNTTFRFVESNSVVYRYRMGIFFNKFHLLDLNETGHVIISKDAKFHLTGDLSLTRFAGDGDKRPSSFLLIVKPFRIPSFYRMHEFVEKIVYKIEFLDLNRTEVFVTDYINNCETIPNGVLWRPKCSVILSKSFPTVLVMGTAAGFLLILLVFVAWVLRGQKRLFRKKHTTIRKKKKVNTNNKNKKTVEFTKRSSSIDSSVCVGVMLPQQQNGTPSRSDDGESALASSVVQATTFSISATGISEEQIAAAFPSNSPDETTSILNKTSPHQVSTKITTIALGEATTESTTTNGEGGTINEGLTMDMIDDIEWAQFQSAPIFGEYLSASDTGDLEDVVPELSSSLPSTKFSSVESDTEDSLPTTKTSTLPIHTDSPDGISNSSTIPAYSSDAEHEKDNKDDEDS